MQVKKGKSGEICQLRWVVGNSPRCTAKCTVDQVAAGSATSRPRENAGMLPSFAIHATSTDIAIYVLGNIAPFLGCSENLAHTTLEVVNGFPR